MLFANIQVLRAFAALAVVAFHTAYIVPGLLPSDMLGVAIFFVISGFLMSYIGRDSAGDFLMRRIIRIVPLYWIGLLGYAAIVVILYPLMGKKTEIVVTGVTLLQDMFFIPRTDGNGNIVNPVLQVGWTLNLEMYFYAIFTLAIFINKKLAPALSATVVMALWVAARLFELPPILEFLGHDYVIYFALGIGIFYCLDNRSADAPVGWIALLAGTVSLTAFAITGNAIAAYLAPPLLVYGSIAVESAGFAIKSRIALLIGASSYALYLFHPFVLGFASTVWPALRGQFLFSVAQVAVCVVVAIVLHKTIELPILRALKFGHSSLLSPSNAR